MQELIEIQVDNTVGHIAGGGKLNEYNGFREPDDKRQSLLDKTVACPSRFHLPEILSDLIAKYPLFIVILYLKRDSKLREHVHEHSELIDNLSSFSCLIWLPEPIGKLGPIFTERWKERLGTLPDWFQTVLEADYSDFERVSCALTDDFAIPPEKLPGFIVAEPQQTQYFFDRFDEDTNLQSQFDALIASARAAQSYPRGKRTKAFRKEWKRRTYSTERALLRGIERFNEWCGVIKNTEKNILNILLPMGPLLQSFLSCFTATQRKP